MGIGTIEAGDNLKGQLELLSEERLRLLRNITEINQLSGYVSDLALVYLLASVSGYYLPDQLRDGAGLKYLGANDIETINITEIYEILNDNAALMLAAFKEIINSVEYIGDERAMER